MAADTLDLGTGIRRHGDQRNLGEAGFGAHCDTVFLSVTDRTKPHTEAVEHAVADEGEYVVTLGGARDRELAVQTVVLLDERDRLADREPSMVMTGHEFHLVAALGDAAIETAPHKHLGVFAAAVIGHRRDLPVWHHHTEHAPPWLISAQLSAGYVTPQDAHTGTASNQKSLGCVAGACPGWPSGSRRRRVPSTTSLNAKLTTLIVTFPKFPGREMGGEPVEKVFTQFMILPLPPHTWRSLSCSSVTDV